MSLTSFEGVPKWSGNLWRIFYYWKFSRELLSFSFRLILSVVSSFFSGLIFYSALVWRVSLGSCLSQKGFLFYRGSKILGGTDPRLQAMYSIICFPAFLSRHSATNNVSWDILPDLQRAHSV